MVMNASLFVNLFFFFAQPYELCSLLGHNIVFVFFKLNKEKIEVEVASGESSNQWSYNIDRPIKLIWKYI